LQLNESETESIDGSETVSQEGSEKFSNFLAKNDVQSITNQASLCNDGQNKQMSMLLTRQILGFELLE
jgi:hypothetical protein